MSDATSYTKGCSLTLRSKPYYNIRNMCRSHHVHFHIFPFTWPFLSTLYIFCSNISLMTSVSARPSEVTQLTFCKVLMDVIKWFLAMAGSQHKQFPTPKIKVWKSKSPFLAREPPSECFQHYNENPLKTLLFEHTHNEVEGNWYIS